MATLDKVIEMQRTGISDQEIARRLQNEGVSPREIYDSINQAKIKMAVSPDSNMDPSMDMQPSILSSQDNMPQTKQNMQSQPQVQNVPAPQMYPPQENYQQQEYYAQTPQAYPTQDYYPQNYPQQTAFDSEAVTEVAEQVASEKINEFKKQMGDIGLFRSVVQDRLSELDDRLKRIENSIDKINHAVIGKIGEFGESSALIHRDLENLHGTVSRLMNPLVDNYNELKKFNDKK